MGPEYMKAYRENPENRERILAAQTAWYLRNRGTEELKVARRAAAKRFYWKHREEILARRAAWLAANPHINRESVRRYKAMRAGQSPKWADKKRIREIYAEAVRRSKATGIPHEVDHIIPLKNPLVCGLHVPENLQVITKSANSAKKNKFEVA